MTDRLPSSATALARSLRMGYRTSPALIVVAFVTTLAAAAPDALLALGLAALVRGVTTADSRQITGAAAAVGVLAIAGWLLDVVSDRVNRRFAERAAIVVESHVARLQSSVATIEHHAYGVAEFLAHVLGAGWAHAAKSIGRRRGNAATESRQQLLRHGM